MGHLPSIGERRDLLRSDCANCFGLCCVALSFSRSADFAVDKLAAEPCTNLTTDFSCGIHARLRESGFTGCTVYDCFGAGQKVSQRTFGGTSWRELPSTRGQMFAVFPIMRELHEMLWYLAEASEIPEAAALRPELAEAFEETTLLSEGEPERILAADVAGHRAGIARLLARVSETVRADAPPSSRSPHLERRLVPGVDLMGAALRDHDLCGANLRSAYLIGADLRGSDLGWADLLGTDLRDAQLAGANLGTALFLTQTQVNSARGDALTVLPPSLERPPQWG